MRTYETKADLTGHQVDDFLTWFDGEIGTETQTNPSGLDDGYFYISFFELEATEVSKVRYYDKNKARGVA